MKLRMWLLCVKMGVTMKFIVTLIFTQKMVQMHLITK